MSTPDVGHGRACLCPDCTSSRLAAEANACRIVKRPDSPFAPQRDHVMTLTTAPAVTPKRGARAE